MSFSRELAEFFYSKSELIVEGQKSKYNYSCRRELLTGQKCSSMKNKFSIFTTAGFQNLKIHTEKCIPNYVEMYDAREEVGAGDIRKFVVVDKKSQNIFRWIEWIVTSNLPFSFVDTEMTRINTQNTRETISRTTLMKYMDQLGYEIEEVLSRILPDRFALAFDGWDNGNSTNYCGVFVMWYDAEKNKDHIYLLRLAPLLRPADFGADSHIETLKGFLSRVGKTLDNVVCLCGDNCETNLAIARRTGIQFMGCHAHRLNLGVKLFLLPDEALLDKINTLMSALSTKKNCGILRSQKCVTMPLRRFVIR